MKVAVAHSTDAHAGIDVEIDSDGDDIVAAVLKGIVAAVAVAVAAVGMGGGRGIGGSIRAGWVLKSGKKRSVEEEMAVEYFIQMVEGQHSTSKERAGDQKEGVDGVRVWGRGRGCLDVLLGWDWIGKIALCARACRAMGV